MEWLCREMDRLFGADPEASCLGSDADRDPGCPGSAGRGHRGAPAEYGSAGTAPTPAPSPDISPRTRYQTPTASSPPSHGRQDRLGPPGRSPEDSPSAGHQRTERPLRGRGEYLTCRRWPSPPSPWADSSGGGSPSADQYPGRSPETVPVRPAVFRFPPAVLCSPSSSVPSPLPVSSQHDASLAYNWCHPEMATTLQRQPESPAAGSPFDTDFPPLCPASVRPRLSSRSPPSPLSPRLPPPSPLFPRLPPPSPMSPRPPPPSPMSPRLPPPSSMSPRLPARPRSRSDALASLPAAAAGGGSALLCRRRRRHRSRVGPAADSPAPKRPGKQMCAFCRKNGESKEVVTSHCLRDSSGRVLCPILRSHVCELCQLTGDHAHTRTYCPLAAGGDGDRGDGRGRPAPSATVQLKSTRHNAAGRRRY